MGSPDDKTLQKFINFAPFEAEIFEKFKGYPKQDMSEEFAECSQLAQKVTF
jgi:hypothetical protein